VVLHVPRHNGILSHPLSPGSHQDMAVKKATSQQPPLHVAQAAPISPTPAAGAHSRRTHRAVALVRHLCAAPQSLFVKLCPPPTPPHRMNRTGNTAVRARWQASHIRRLSTPRNSETRHRVPAKGPEKTRGSPRHSHGGGGGGGSGSAEGSASVRWPPVWRPRWSPVVAATERQPLVRVGRSRDQRRSRPPLRLASWVEPAACQVGGGSGGSCNASRTRPSMSMWSDKDETHALPSEPPMLCVVSLGLRATGMGRGGYV